MLSRKFGIIAQARLQVMGQVGGGPGCCGPTHVVPAAAAHPQVVYMQQQPQPHPQWQSVPQQQLSPSNHMQVMHWQYPSQAPPGSYPQQQVSDHDSMVMQVVDGRVVMPTSFAPQQQQLQQPQQWQQQQQQQQQQNKGLYMQK